MALLLPVAGCKSGGNAKPPPPQDTAQSIPLTKVGTDVRDWLYQRHPVGSDVAPLEQRFRDSSFSCKAVEKDEAGDDCLYFDYQRPSGHWGVGHRWLAVVAHRDGRIKNIKVTFAAVGL